MFDWIHVHGLFVIYSCIIYSLNVFNYPISKKKSLPPQEIGHVLLEQNFVTLSLKSFDITSLQTD